jgi:hypothetical protein
VPRTESPGVDATADPADVAAATGSADAHETELAPEEEPVVTGTLFLTIVLLMIIAGFWVIIYQRLLTR